MSRRTHQKAIAKLEALYAQLPTVACKGLCGIACGPVPMALLEAQRMRKADPQRRLPMIHTHPTSGRFTCVYLTKAERCGVYPVRPLICRVWGVVKRMSCMHGCVPDRWLSDHEFVALGKAIERLGGPNIVSGPQGPEPGPTFFNLDTTTIPEDLADVFAEKTKNLRALYGGRIVGVSPRDDTDEEWINVDKERR